MCPAQSTHAKARIIALSGPSSSGKTTISRLLRSLIPNSFILHEDDFFLPEAQLPHTAKHLDWDSPSSLDIIRLASALSYIHTHGELPPWLESREDQNTVGPATISPTILDDQRQRLVESGINPSFHETTRLSQEQQEHQQQLQQPPRRQVEKVICILDGFLLYPLQILDQIDQFLDLKLFLPVSYNKMKERREARKGYVTAEGFWEDPEGYVDEVVWPNYVRDHKFLFEKGDIEGSLDCHVAGELGIEAWEDWKEGSLEQALVWAVAVLSKAFGTGRG